MIVLIEEKLYVYNSGTQAAISDSPLSYVYYMPASNCSDMIAERGAVEAEDMEVLMKD